ncbi:hypothetical protein Pmar_PMAR029490 [Perkinsus marinus ATCC 50983]|uniref:MULE transposase domain-containing protein n=1 Tax=Perkinsus marinus (strain ATCC 50983 / TXsc) TaxID=423536 RepID=C5LFG3_PERM5|nr:hypothetical protein Pmar_PMAR029490 [Perkinsus marinus ATCC 50983]EER04527.1 hypothetical protein Pmar_PMAR029490 [Perkinsus marinus ATCC 50983]|eukprot:XP_002772711.1 hypothetical protein Pmar_PMAR029490 [Perkinsus marinus ATCC 50983]
MVSYWCCYVAHKNPRCSATLVLRGDIDGPASELEVLNDDKRKAHICGGENVQLRTTYNDMREAAAAADAETNLSAIYARVLNSQPDNVVNRLPKRKSVQENLRITRQRAQNLPKLPRARADFAIPDGYKIVRIGGEDQPSLLFDSGSNDADRILVWYDSRSLHNLLATTSELHISMDGTFKRCANKWAQQYTVLIRHSTGRMIPVFFCLLPHKDTITYRRLFDVLVVYLGDNVVSCMMDMEKAAMIALKEVWPDCRISICLFHFGQAIYRKFGSWGYWVATADDLAKVRERTFYNLMALPFLPTRLFDAGLRVACSDLPQPQYLRVRNYMRSTYGVFQFFHPSRWNQIDRVLQNLPRTNNAQEGFHRHWNTLFRNHNHPNIWVWIGRVHDQFAANRLDLIELARGNIPRRKAYYVETDYLLYEFCSEDTSQLSPEDLPVWFARARAIVRRVVPRTEVEKDFDDYFEDLMVRPPSPDPEDAAPVLLPGVENDSADVEGGIVVLNIPDDHLIDVSGLLEADVPEMRLAGSVPNTVVGAESLSGEARAVSTPPSKTTTDDHPAPSSSGSPPWVSFDIEGHRLSVSEMDHAELMQEGSFVADSVVDLWMRLLWRAHRDRMFHPQCVWAASELNPYGYNEVSSSDGVKQVLQPIFVDGSHYAAVARLVGGDILYMDSLLHEEVPAGAVAALTQLFGHNKRYTVVGVQQQRSNTCALHTIARLTEILLCDRGDATRTFFAEEKMRIHVEECLRNGNIKRFPRRRGPRSRVSPNRESRTPAAE